jgi:hypothetical protein
LPAFVRATPMTVKSEPITTPQKVAGMAAIVAATTSNAVLPSLRRSRNVAWPHRTGGVPPPPVAVVP